MRKGDNLGKYTAAALLISAALLFSGVKVSAEAYSLTAGKSGEILAEKNGDEKYPCGTLSKLMTVMIAAEKIHSGELLNDETLTVSERANSVGGAKIWLMPADRISVSELMKAVIIGNANDASIVLAERISGSEEEFVKLMNQKASELSMNDTHYVNSHGYRSDGDYTTANDTVRLLCALSEYGSLRDIFLTRTENIRDDTVMLVTSNPAAVSNPDAVGFKSGFFEEDGKKIYYSAEGMKRGDESFFSAALGYSDEYSSAEKAFSLLEYGFSAYDTAELIHPEETPSEITVKGGKKGKIRISADDSGSAVIRSGGKADISCRAAIPEYVYAPVKKGQKVGELLYFYKDKLIFVSDITAASSSEKKTIGYSMYKLLKNMCDFG